MADSIFPQGDGPSSRFVLMAPDGQFATYDTRTGPQLTPTVGLSYVWTSPEAAEGQRSAYESALGTSLTVEDARGGK